VNGCPATAFLFFTFFEQERFFIFLESRPPHFISPCEIGSLFPQEELWQIGGLKALLATYLFF
jgi:hypothetical protein